MTDPLLEIVDLRVRIDGPDGAVEPVRGVSLALARGETLGLVGESGSGKSLSALALMRLLTPPGKSSHIALSGQALLHLDAAPTVDLLAASDETIRSMRGRAISMIFQDPMTSLNPVMRVGIQIAESMLAHEKIGLPAAMRRTTDMLRLVGIADPEARSKLFPHELSGGMRQRVMIAMALSCRPQLLIADEPTTALDVTVQAQVLRLMKRLQDEIGMAMLFISHDLGVVAQLADRVAVMYAGRIVEEAPVRELFADARHPYTRGLLRSVPDPFAPPRSLDPIPGTVPRLSELPRGCAFHPRCAAASASGCETREPPIEHAGPGRSIRCWNWRAELQERARG